MSSGKKSKGTLILFLLIFLVAAGASWFYFSGQKSANVADNISEQAEYADNHEHEQDHNHNEDHAAHDHGSAQNANSESKIHQLTVDPALGVRSIGNPEAPVKIQEFFSLTCNHCADFHKGTYQELKSKYIDTGKIYYVYQEFPLNGPALYGSMIARCLPEDRYTGFIDLLLRTQDKWAFGGDFKSALQQNAALAGMSEEDFNACFNNQELQKAIASNIKEASDVWKISSTPSFVINDGERVLSGGQPIEVFDTVISELSEDKSDSAAGMVDDADVISEIQADIENEIEQIEAEQ